MSSAAFAAPITSRSPSPSISPVITLLTPLKLFEIVCVVQPPPEPLFSHHVMSLALLAAPIRSISPSPSISPVVTLVAPTKLPETVCGPPNGTSAACATPTEPANGITIPAASIKVIAPLIVRRIIRCQFSPRPRQRNKPPKRLSKNDSWPSRQRLIPHTCQ